MTDKIEVRSWRDVKSDARVDPSLIATARRDFLDALNGERLAELRRNRGLTQTQVASTLGVGQPRISQLESNDIGRSELATVRAYIEALGGALHVVADFGDSTVRIS